MLDKPVHLKRCGVVDGGEVSAYTLESNSFCKFLARRRGHQATHDHEHLQVLSKRKKSCTLTCENPVMLFYNGVIFRAS